MTRSHNEDDAPTAYGMLKTKRHAKALGRTYKKRDAPLKACMHCGEVQPNGTRVCPSCGTEHFPKVKRESPFVGVRNEDRGTTFDKRYIR